MRENVKVIAVIPARRGSTRLPEKPLREIDGTTLVQRVWEQARTCTSLDALMIATDDEEIGSLARSFGARVVMTSSQIPSGSARVAAAVETLDMEWDIAMNIQGDMPFIDPRVIDMAIKFFKDNFERFSMVTIAVPIRDLGEFLRPDAVKVVVSEEGRALYFSRASIPHPRDGDRWDILSDDENPFYGLKHIGLYLFREKALADLRDWEVSKLEKVEKLEQLKLLERGHAIGVCVVPAELMERSIEVDTEEDLKAAEIEAKRNKIQ
jgi:3-deoxy-manno-octulosonate cytidylyltransferase (CMP-KDO synthetase)